MKIPQPSKPEAYRRMIDALVDMCHAGQGQIGAERARAGVWNRNACIVIDEDQEKMNLLVHRMSVADREVLAKMLAQEVECGVFETLKVLEQFEVAPFQSGYEGSPYNDFVGRLDGWPWPE